MLEFQLLLELDVGIAGRIHFVVVKNGLGHRRGKEEARDGGGGL